jgi:hypothetical protein
MAPSLVHLKRISPIPIALLLGLILSSEFYNPILTTKSKLGLLLVLEVALGEHKFGLVASCLYYGATGYGFVIYATNLSQFFTFWQILRFFPLIFQQTWGSESDHDDLNRMAMVEACNCLYFLGPVFVATLRIGYTYWAIITVTIISIIGTWFLLPTEIFRLRKSHALGTAVRTLILRIAMYEASIGHYFLSVYERIFYSFRLCESYRARERTKVIAPLKSCEYSKLESPRHFGSTRFVSIKVVTPRKASNCLS